MPAKRLAALILTPLLLSSFLLSQSLAEIAQKERERRASMKGKKVVVITNADLARLKKKPALEVPAAPPAPTLEEKAAAVPPAPPGQQPQDTPAPTTPAAPAKDSRPATLQELQQKLDKAKEYVELLTLKMGALWQELNGLRDAQAKEAVQQAIGETFVKLQTAQEEETRARQALEKFLADTRKESKPSIWIK